MYNRYHNYAATQLYRINENGRFSVPAQYNGSKLVKLAEKFVSKMDGSLQDACKICKQVWDRYGPTPPKSNKHYEQAMQTIEKAISNAAVEKLEIEKFKTAYDAAWNKLDDDLFNTARL